jgi:16S rRNA (adenine1518-N6/adenine1519-N6)-dimethyltransferase
MSGREKGPASRAGRTAGRFDHFAKKRFGQHFLHERSVIDRIVRAINPQPGDRLVEIGPGLGALTLPLLERAGALAAVEIDRDVIPKLQDACGLHPGLTVIQADALALDFRSVWSDLGGSAGLSKLRLVGNLPYNISTPLMFHLLETADVVQDMHFMLQKEVVRRMGAAPGTEDYGRLTVTIAARAAVDEMFTVAPGAFWPPPQVDSAVVRLVPRPPPFPIDNLERFDHVVKLAFGQRRKTLANALKSVASADAITRADVDPRARGETLSAADFARLSNALGK